MILRPIRAVPPSLCYEPKLYFTTYKACCSRRSFTTTHHFNSTEDKERSNYRLQVNAFSGSKSSKLALSQDVNSNDASSPSTGNHSHSPNVNANANGHIDHRRRRPGLKKRRDFEVEGYEFDESRLSVSIDGRARYFEDIHQLRSYKRRLIRSHREWQAQEQYEKELRDFRYLKAEEGQPAPLEPQSQGKVATLAEAVPLITKTLEPRLGGRFKQSTAQPYSLPDPFRFVGLNGTQQQRVSLKMGPGAVEAAPSYAAQSTRPLLLTFDAFGTLFAPRDPVEQQYAEVFQRFGYPSFDVSEIKQSFRAQFKQLLNEWPNYGKGKAGVDVSVWWTRLIERTLSRLIKAHEERIDPSLREQIPAGLAENLYNRFKSDEGYAIFPDVLELLEVIGTAYQAAVWAPSRTMLGIISNTDPRIVSILESFDVHIKAQMAPQIYAPQRGRTFWTKEPKELKRRQMTFSFSTLSYECEVSKPAPEIYQAAIRDAQLALDRLPTEDRLTRTALDVLEDINRDFHHIHVGDDVDNDIAPSLQLGWDAILIDRSKSEALTYREIAGHQVPVINNLMQLQQLVKKDRIESKDGPGSRWINVDL